MYKKLIFVLCFFASWATLAQDVPIKFKDVEAAKNWVKKNYENQESERYQLEKDKQPFEVYAVYGRSGSGIERVHGWFFFVFGKFWLPSTGDGRFGDWAKTYKGSRGLC